MILFSNIKRKISEFISSEEGRVSKETLLNAGLLATVAAVGAVGILANKVFAQSQTSITYENGQIVGTHTTGSTTTLLGSTTTTIPGSTTTISGSTTTIPGSTTTIASGSTTTIQPPPPPEGELGPTGPETGTGTGGTGTNVIIIERQPVCINIRDPGTQLGVTTVTDTLSGTSVTYGSFERYISSSGKIVDYVVDSSTGITYRVVSDFNPDGTLTSVATVITPEQQQAELIAWQTNPSLPCSW